MKMVFTPVTVFLIILCIASLVFPYDYFTRHQLTNFIAGAFPLILATLLPIDLFLRLFFARDIKRLWIIEIVGLILCGVIIFFLT